MNKMLCVRNLQKIIPFLGSGKQFHASSLRLAKFKEGDYIPKGYADIKIKQAKFQMDDGLPVFLKGGSRDMFLYKTTMVLAVLGVLWGLGFTIGLICESIPPSENAKFTQDPMNANRDC